MTALWRNPAGTSQLLTCLTPQQHSMWTALFSTFPDFSPPFPDLSIFVLSVGPLTWNIIFGLSYPCLWLSWELLNQYF